MRWLRRDKPPSDLVAVLDRDERVLAWATAEGDAVIAATPKGLWLPVPPVEDRAGGRRRLGWHRVDKATWRDPEFAVIPATDMGVVPAAGTDVEVVEDGPPLRWQLTDPRGLPPVVRTRVTRSVAYSEHFPLEPVGGVRVVGRRVPGRDGVFWQVRYDRGTDQDSAYVKARVAELVAQAQQTFPTVG
jgi:hypothetical protein